MKILRHTRVKKEAFLSENIYVALFAYETRDKKRKEFYQKHREIFFTRNHTNKKKTPRATGADKLILI